MVMNHLLFAGNICVFILSISGIQRLPNICYDYAAEGEVIFKRSGRAKFVEQAKYLGVQLHDSLNSIF